MDDGGSWGLGGAASIIEAAPVALAKRKTTVPLSARRRHVLWIVQSGEGCYQRPVVEDAKRLITWRERFGFSSSDESIAMLDGFQATPCSDGPIRHPMSTGLREKKLCDEIPIVALDCALSKLIQTPPETDLHVQLRESAMVGTEVGNIVDRVREAIYFRRCGCRWVNRHGRHRELLRVVWTASEIQPDRIGKIVKLEEPIRRAVCKQNGTPAVSCLLKIVNRKRAGKPEGAERCVNEEVRGHCSRHLKTGTNDPWNLVAG